MARITYRQIRRSYLNPGDARAAAACAQCGHLQLRLRIFDEACASAVRTSAVNIVTRWPAVHPASHLGAYQYQCRISVDAFGPSCLLPVLCAHPERAHQTHMSG